jgi:Glycosyl hydrolase catalytic core
VSAVYQVEASQAGQADIVSVYFARYYNWSPIPAYPQSAMDGLEYVPMFWGNQSISQFGGVPNLVSGGGIEVVLGMNECVAIFWLA